MLYIKKMGYNKLVMAYGIYPNMYILCNTWNLSGSIKNNYKKDGLTYDIFYRL